MKFPLNKLFAGTMSALVFLAAMGSAAGGGGDVKTAGKARVGEQLPRLGAFDLSQEKAISAEQLLRKPGTKGLVIEFFATWCEPCMKDLGLLVRGQKKLGDAGLEVLLVNEMEEPDMVKEAVEKMGLGVFPLIRDATGAIAEDFGIKTQKDGGEGFDLPLAIVADGKGIVRMIIREASDDHLDKILKSL